MRVFALCGGGVVRKLADWMKDYGFKDDANGDVTEAFVRHLIKSAYGVEVSPRGALPRRPYKKWEQLEFDFMRPAASGEIPLSSATADISSKIHAPWQRLPKRRRR